MGELGEYPQSTKPVCTRMQRRSGVRFVLVGKKRVHCLHGFVDVCHAILLDG